MGKHRKHIDIIAEVLKATDKENGKASIMHRINLSYAGLRKYLNLVCFCGLVDVVFKKYVLTTKGRNFLEQYDSIVQKSRFIVESNLELHGQLEAVENMLEIMTSS